MYNNEIKEKYISQLSQEDVSAARKAFGKSELFETALERDLMFYDKEERLDLYKTMQLGEIEEMSVIHQAINQYVQWCIDEKLILENRVYQLNITELKTVLK